MKWYAAHAVLYIKFKTGRQQSYPVWENVYLIRAANLMSAEKKASRRAREDEGDSRGSLVWDGRTATFVFGGIRKITEVVDTSTDGAVVSGAEITFSEYTVQSKSRLQALIKGRPVDTRYVE